MEYFIVMIEYPGAREAVVNPEITRREVIARISSGEYDRERISFIHRVRDCTVEDVTAELIEAAGLPPSNVREINLTIAKWDHDRDLRKHEDA